jgi:anti-sigma B factor antagonist
MPKQRLRVEQVDDVTVVYFLDKRILDEPTIQAIAEQLFSLVDRDDRRKLLLNFSDVEYLSSAALGKLINLHNKLQAEKGKLAMCSVFRRFSRCSPSPNSTRFSRSFRTKMPPWRA